MEMTARSAATFLATSTLLLLVAAVSADDVNVLMSGVKFSEGDVLKYGKYSFSMKSDCNLVLCNDQIEVWSSHTQDPGARCSLYLTKFGDLLVSTGNGTEVWRSGTGGKQGHYALVLQPNGDLVVYGDAVWSTGVLST